MDEYTRAIVMSYVGYSAGYNLFSEINWVRQAMPDGGVRGRMANETLPPIKQILERSVHGLVLPQSRVYTVRMDMYSSDVEKVVGFFEFVCVCAATYIIGMEILIVRYFQACPAEGIESRLTFSTCPAQGEASCASCTRSSGSAGEKVLRTCIALRLDRDGSGSCADEVHPVL